MRIRRTSKGLLFFNLNLFDIANLSGYSTTLEIVNANPAAQTFQFGQPTARVAQVFASGGPRAFQVGGRFTF